MSENAWRDARILVTGARGFIATRLCQRLNEAGAIVNGVSGNLDFPGTAGVRWWRADMTDLASVRQVVGSVAPDIVFHLGGYVTGSQKLECVQRTFSANLTSTVHLLTVVGDQGRCRVVQAGSMQEPAFTDGSWIPHSPYAASKWASSAYARMFHALYQCPVVIARVYMVYGPGQWDLSKVLPYVTVSLLNGDPPKLSSGKHKLDWVYIDDVVEGLMRLAMSPHLSGRTVDFGTGRVTSVREVVERLVALVGSSVPVLFGALADRPFERPRVAGVDETQRLMGWAASTSLSEGLGRTVAWYREQLAQGALASHAISLGSAASRNETR